MNHKKKCRIGIIGAGRIGTLHAQNIKNHLPQFSLESIADPYIDYGWAEQLRIPKISSVVEDVLSDSELDAVLIASPSDLHIEHIKKACEHSKAIFCEKPIGLIEEDIVKLLDYVSNNNTLLQLGFNRRFDPSFSSIQKAVQKGEVGMVHLVKITSRDPQCPSKEYCASSGGIFMDMSIHDFDMARFLTQSEVVEVYAGGSVLINPEFEAFNDVDTAIIQLRFANGALGVIDNSRQAVYGYDQRVEVFGSEGMLEATNLRPNSVVYSNKTGTIQSNPLYFFLERYNQAYISELSAFYDCWIEGHDAPITGMDGLQALRIAKAASLSLEQNKPVRVLK